MRVALFAETFLPKTDGVATTTCHLLEHLSRRGHQALVFAPEGAPERYAGMPVVGISGFRFPLYPELRLASPLVSLDNRLAAFRPDVVHLINPALLGLVGLRQARRMNVPVVASYHTDIPGYAEQYYGLGALSNPLWGYFRWIHNQADVNFCPSRFTQAQLRDHGFQRVKVWPHGVDTARFNPRRYRYEWRVRLCGGAAQASQPLLLYVGRLAAEKRVEWLCPLIEALPGVRLAIVGDGPMRRALEDMFSGTPTVFTGFLRGDDLACAYASADLFVFPSSSETFGNVILEAMASGLPVIAPRAGGPVDHVIDGYNGFLFSPNDPEEMIALTRSLVWAPEYAQQIGDNARAYALSQSWEEILDALLDEYRALVQRYRSNRYPTGLRMPFGAQSPQQESVAEHARPPTTA
jgi:phosphatidylinositol alpha 1,6-mannosyltransferase